MGPDQNTERSPYAGPSGFLPGNPGRPKGIIDKRQASGRKAALALAAKAWDVVEALLASEDERIKLDSAKVVLEYAHGKPRQTLTVEDLRERADEIIAGHALNRDDVIALAGKIAEESAPS